MISGRYISHRALCFVIVSSFILAILTGCGGGSSSTGGGYSGSGDSGATTPTSQSSTWTFTADHLNNAIAQDSEIETKWKASETGVTKSMSEDDFAKTCNAVDPKQAEPLQQVKNDRIDFPASFAWYEKDGKNYLTTVKNQAKVATSAAFANVAAMETMLNIQNNTPGAEPDLSESDLINRSLNTAFAADSSRFEGPILLSKIKKALLNAGVVEEKVCPYTDLFTFVQPPVESILYKPAGYLETNSAFAASVRGRDNMKQALLKGPLVSCIDVYSDFAMFGRQDNAPFAAGLDISATNPYIPTKQNLNGKPNKYLGMHSVLIVGWQDVGSAFAADVHRKISYQGVWICKNSFGLDWGNQGFFTIPFDRTKAEQYAYQITGVKLENLGGQTTPEISSIKPSMGPYKAGDVITIAGTGFGDKDSFKFRFKAKNLTGTIETNELPVSAIQSWNPSEIQFQIPVGIPSHGLEAVSISAFAAQKKGETLIHWPTTGSVESLGTYGNTTLKFDIYPNAVLQWDGSTATVKTPIGSKGPYQYAYYCSFSDGTNGGPDGSSSPTYTPPPAWLEKTMTLIGCNIRDNYNHTYSAEKKL